MAAKFGEAQVLVWRRSYDTPPPALDPGDPRYEARDPRYRRHRGAADRVPQGHGGARDAVLERADRARGARAASACSSRRTAIRCAR